jgi:hypothetical protein
LTQFLELLHDFDEVHFRTLFVDGTKFEANANRYTFGWRKSIGKYRAKLQGKCRTFLLNHFAKEDLLQHHSAEFLERLALIRRKHVEMEDKIFMVSAGVMESVKGHRNVRRLCSQSGNTKCTQIA